MALQASLSAFAILNPGASSAERSRMNRLFSFHYSCKAVSFAIFALLVANLPADSLWREGRARSMVGDKRAAAVGDILNIVVQENSTATKDNKTKTSKQSAIDSSIQAFLYSPAASKLFTKGGTLPAVTSRRSDPSTSVSPFTRDRTKSAAPTMEWTKYWTNSVASYDGR